MTKLIYYRWNAFCLFLIVKWISRINRIWLGCRASLAHDKYSPTWIARTIRVRAAGCRIGTCTCCRCWGRWAECRIWCIADSWGANWACRSFDGSNWTQSLKTTAAPLGLSRFPCPFLQFIIAFHMTKKNDLKQKNLLEKDWRPSSCWWDAFCRDSCCSRPFVAAAAFAWAPSFAAAESPGAAGLCRRCSGCLTRSNASETRRCSSFARCSDAICCSHCSCWIWVFWSGNRWGGCRRWAAANRTSTGWSAACESFLWCTCVSQATRTGWAVSVARVRGYCSDLWCRWGRACWTRPARRVDGPVAAAAAGSSQLGCWTGTSRWCLRSFWLPVVALICSKRERFNLFI